MSHPSEPQSSNKQPNDTVAPVGSETINNQRVWKAIAGVGLKAESGAESKEMVVICAGLGRTGTSSLKLALKQLGLKPYHMADGVMETKGHTDLWMNHAVLPALAESPPATSSEMGSTDDLKARAKSGIKRYGFENQGEGIVQVMRGVAAAGFDASTDMPACYIWHALAVAHPEAKIILSRRQTGEKWSKSVMSTIGQNIPYFQMAPFKYVPMFKNFLKMNHWMWASSGVPADLWETKDWSVQGELGQALAASHDAWAELVREAYAELRGGSEQIVELIPKDGAENWKKLQALLAGTPYEAKCRALVESGEPWPFENETAEMQKVYRVFKLITQAWKILPVLLVAVIAAVIAFMS